LVSKVQEIDVYMQKHTRMDSNGIYQYTHINF
jgi:hypothetical protein